MLEEALRYQTQGEDWLKRVGIGGVLVFFGQLLYIPVFTINGYMLEVMRRVFRGEREDPPEWGEQDPVELTVDGLKHFVVVLPYGLLVTFLAGIPLLLLLLVGIVIGSEIMLFLLVSIGLFLYLLVFLAVGIIAPVATGNFVKEGEISGGFDIGVIRTLVTNRTMLRAVGLGIVVNIVGFFVSIAFLITIIGIFALPFVGFAFQSALFYVWADGFADAYEEEFGEPPIPDRAPTDIEEPGTGVEGTV